MNSVDMTKTTAPKSDQMNYDDFIGGGTKTIRITDVKAMGNSDDQQPIAIHYEGDGGKPWKPCKSMRRVLVHGWGGDGLKYIGKSLTLFGDPNVLWGGQKVGGIRISHMSDLENEINISLTASKNQRKLHQVKPLKVDMGNVDPEIDEDELMKEAREFCKGGKDNFKAYHKTLSKPQKAVLKNHMDELQKICEEGDKSDDEDPFNEQSAETPASSLEGDADEGEPEKVPDEQQPGSPAPIEDKKKWMTKAKIILALDDCKTDDEVDHLIAVQSLGIADKSETDRIAINNAVIDRKKVISNG